MSKIALYDYDKTKFPNLALMKISTFHKQIGDEVEWYLPIMSKTYDKVYCSKVFTFTKFQKIIHNNVEYGGTGININSKLPEEIEIRKPDYDLYDNIDYSLGFLTRGCPNKCSWCIVPSKEGDIRVNSDIEDFLDHNKAVLMDNNVLAHEHGIKQIEKIIRLGIKVDFNQGLDARLIDDSVAKLLSNVKWLKCLRLACDNQSQMKHVENAVRLLRWHNTRPAKFFIYCLVKDIPEALERVKFLKGLYLDPFAQPFIDFENNKMPSREQKQFSRWVNHKAIFGSVAWEDYNKK